jgi:hypothetical protein
MTVDREVTHLNMPGAAQAKKARASQSRESDRAKFVDLANKRVSRVLQTVQLIGNLSNRSNYHYTEEDVAKIFRALHDELSACKKRFDLALKKQGHKKLFNLE